MAFVGPITLVCRVIRRLSSVGWTRAAGSLAFTTLLGLVPLATVAFAFVAQFPVFQDFLRVLENYLLRYTLPETASALVQTYVVGLATEAASLKGVWILFVIVTAALVVDSVESEINAIWRIRRKRPDHAAGRRLHDRRDRRAGDARRRDHAHHVAVSPFGRHRHAAAEHHPGDVPPVTFLLAALGFTLLYVIAPARKVEVAARADRRPARRGRVRSDAPRLRVVRRAFADVRNSLRRAGRGADVHAVGVRVLDDRAGRRGGDGVARRRREQRVELVTIAAGSLSCRIEARTLHFALISIRSMPTCGPSSRPRAGRSGR